MKITFYYSKKTSVMSMGEGEGVEKVLANKFFPKKITGENRSGKLWKQLFSCIMPYCLVRYP